MVSLGPVQHNRNHDSPRNRNLYGPKILGDVICISLGSRSVFLREVDQPSCGFRSGIGAQQIIFQSFNCARNVLTNYSTPVLLIRSELQCSGLLGQHGERERCQPRNQLQICLSSIRTRLEDHLRSLSSAKIPPGRKMMEMLILTFSVSAPRDCRVQTEGSLCGAVAVSVGSHREGFEKNHAGYRRKHRKVQFFLDFPRNPFCV
jgi:hypothetical protein